MAKNPIKITDTTFRDGHQSLMATRLRMEDMEPIAGKMDEMGFHSMEVWGGATFDVATRFLAEDPWERLRTFKRLMPKTPLMMLLRGQSLVGYRTYADDLVDAFVQRSAEVGIDIFRVFDALNDERNIERAAEAVKKNGKHLQLAICYTVTEEGRLGGPIYNLDYFVGKAKSFQEMGADSICLKDMGGLLAPYDAAELVTAMKSVLDVPLQLHTHYTSGMASMTALKAIEAGLDVLDTCLSPLALRTAQPAIEPLVVALSDSDRETGLDLERILELDDYLESVLPKYRQYLESPRAAVIDAKVLKHQIPGGMSSNLISQLREADALDRLDEVLEEIPRIRKELGYPPLVTPMSQMTGSQAVSNVLFGRYKMVSGQIKDYVLGFYGESPAPIDNEVVKMVLRNSDAKPIDGRPADAIEPEMEKAKEAVKDISTDIEDALTYAMYPTTGLTFLKIKHGLEPMPEEMKPKTLEQVERERATASQGASNALSDTPPRSRFSRQFNVYVGEQHFQVEVDPLQPAQGMAVRPVPSARPETSQPAAAPEQAPAQKAAPGDAQILAPIPGVVLRYAVEVGQDVAEGDPVVVLEAMKMENTLPAPISGKVKSLPSQPGETVAKGAVLAVISS
ncbi:MAG: pyruvate carboxylase subunit B [Chloroflexi bacterium]|nr:pyruvate carboxylase subunit B [Chloroflexota bacterium]